VRRVRVEDSSSAKVKVMTIHASKGLEFDAVVVPELDHRWAARPDVFVSMREHDDPDKPIVTASRSGDETLRALLSFAGDDEIREAHVVARRKALRDELSSLYVAMTRARHRLDLILWSEGAAKEEARLNAAGVVRHAFGLGHGDLEADATVYVSDGCDASWGAARDAAAQPFVRSEPTRLAFGPSVRARELERVRPSAGEAVVGDAGAAATEALFAPRAERGQLRGSRWHAWFERIEWLEDFAADDVELRALATRQGLGGAGLDDDLSEFRAALRRPKLAALLSRGGAAREVWRERRFRLIVDGKLVSGAFDRVVIDRDGGRPTGAVVIDFKSDRELLDAAARVERYRPQLEAYRTALARILTLPLERISAQLAFVADDEISEL